MVNGYGALTVGRAFMPGMAQSTAEVGAEVLEESLVVRALGGFRAVCAARLLLCCCSCFGSVIFMVARLFPSSVFVLPLHVSPV
jgi:hypothetical protein